MENMDMVNRVISTEQKEFYKEYGFVQVDNILTKDEIAELTSYMEEAMSEQDSRSQKTSTPDMSYYRVLNQKVNVWRDHAGIARYTAHPLLAKVALELAEASGIRLFHDQALWKMPQDSKETPWHQDFPYWPMNDEIGSEDVNRTKTVSAWIPLDDVDETNGCMMFVPGSQKIGKLQGIDLVNPQNIFDEAKGTAIDTTKPVQVPLRKGSCTFHNGLTFHYAHANKTDKPRRVLAIIYMPDGTTYNGKAHIITDPLNLEQNEKLQGGMFPLLAIR
jgi:ectoine hydroxylase-related dioxygenase (phytanoyl-CoA dioxygenase family)